MTRPIAAVVSTVLVAFALAFFGLERAHPAQSAPLAGPRASHVRTLTRSHHLHLWNHHGPYSRSQSGSGTGIGRAAGMWILAFVALAIAVPIVIVLAIAWFLWRLVRARR